MTFVNVNQHVTKTDQTLLAIGTLFVVYKVVWSPEPLASALVAWNPILLLTALVRPFLACTMFVAFSLFRIHEAIPLLSDFNIPAALGTFTLLSLGVHVVMTRTLKPVFTLELLLLTVFFLISVAGIGLATDRMNSFLFLSTSYWKIAVMAFAIAWLARKPNDFILFMRTMVLSGGLIGAVAIYNWINHIGLVEGTRITIGLDIKSVLSDPNDLCLILLFPLSFAVVMALLKSSSTDAIIGRICSPILAYSVILTQSRGGLLGILAVSGTIGTFFFRSKRTLLITVILIGAIFFVLMGIAKRSSGGLDQISIEGGLDESSEGRIIAWQTAFRMALAHPLTGVGIANFAETFFYYTDTWLGKDIAPHSTWFGVLAETGFIGFFVYIAVVIACMRSCIKFAVETPARADVPPIMATISLGLLAGLVGFVVAGSFLTQGFTWPPYILFGLTSALKLYMDKPDSGPACPSSRAGISTNSGPAVSVMARGI